MGIGGTGMAATAGIALEAGFSVTGSDVNLYPPMSTMLEELGIEVLSPYSPSNLDKIDPQLIIVANALSRGHEELEAALARDIPYTSFPAFLGENVLAARESIVVTGTHGKTTTSSLLAYALKSLGVDPGYMIGGIPRDLSRSFHIGKGATFVIEGDEYDTAFFDKNSKFLHYRPKYLLINNLEFDHADIFKDLSAIEAQFHKLLELTKDPAHICANIDNPNVRRLIEDAGLSRKITHVSTRGHNNEADFTLLKAEPDARSSHWRIQIKTPANLWGNIDIESKLSGHHNAANICQVVACLGTLYNSGLIPKETSKQDIMNAIGSFTGVARRMDHLGSANGIDVFEDFAHHPTAVAEVLNGLRESAKNGRLLVAFEPKNASSRRSVFLDAFAKSLKLADQVFIAPCPVDQRIPEDQRMNTEKLANLVGSSARAYETHKTLLADLISSARKGDTVIFMSSGSFAGIQHEIVKKIASLA